ncbi:MAG: gephyrin-like molybdotransferase receptor GlpR, partial [Pseudonocardiaceae bacterium]
MPSSLIFAALAGAWLVVLVPMFAKRRQEVMHTAESVLESRVLRRPGPPRAALHHEQEVHMIGVRTAHQEPVADERRYRSGRGGYDPEVAAELARAKYVFRQRVVIGLVLGAIVSVVLVFTMASLWWWLQATFDVALIGYLSYLRRQVHIEDDIRERRAARLAGPRIRERATGDLDNVHGGLADEFPEADRPVQEPSAPAVATSSVPHPTAVALDSDDGDPV